MKRESGSESVPPPQSLSPHTGKTMLRVCSIFFCVPYPTPESWAHAGEEPGAWTEAVLFLPDSSPQFP